MVHPVQHSGCVQTGSFGWFGGSPETATRCGRPIHLLERSKKTPALEVVSGCLRGHTLPSLLPITVRIASNVCERTPAQAPRAAGFRPLRDCLRLITA